MDLERRRIVPERLAQRLLQPLALRAAGQIDEVDHDRATEIAQTNLPGDLRRRCEVDVEGRPPAAVDIDRDAGGRGLDQQPPAAWQRHLATPAPSPAPHRRRSARTQARRDQAARVRSGGRVGVGARAAARPRGSERRSAISSCAGPRSARPRSSRPSDGLFLGQTARVASARPPRGAAPSGPTARRPPPAALRPGGRRHGGAARTGHRGTAPAPARVAPRPGGGRAAAPVRRRPDRAVDQRAAEQLDVAGNPWPPCRRQPRACPERSGAGPRAERWRIGRRSARPPPRARPWPPEAPAAAGRNRERPR